MKPLLPIAAVLACLTLAGCQSKQARLAKLEDEYSTAHKLYYDDCIAPAYGAAGMDAYFKGTKPKIPTPQEEAAQQQKCKQEAQHAGELQQQLQAAAQ